MQFQNSDSQVLKKWAATEELKRSWQGRQTGKHRVLWTRIGGLRQEPNPVPPPKFKAMGAKEGEKKRERERERDLIISNTVGP